MADTAVVVIAFGGPASLEQVAPFMARLTGRTPPPAMLERVMQRYRAIGGGSPLPAIVREQAAALERVLANEGRGVTVRAAFKYADPSIEDVVAELARAGCVRIVGVSVSPHYSRVTTGAYFAALKDAAASHGLTAVTGEAYFRDPNFLDALAAQARRALADLGSDAVDLVFSAHSLPVEHIAEGDPYVEELRATVAGLLERLPAHPWHLAYQSRNFGQGDWLEPTVEAVLEGLAARGKRSVLLLPVGFTCDHVETLYDIDVEIAGRARALGCAFRRASALNVDAKFIEALAATVRPYLPSS